MSLDARADPPPLLSDLLGGSAAGLDAHPRILTPFGRSSLENSIGQELAVFLL